MRAKLNDIQTFLKVLTWKKVSNLASLIRSYYRSRRRGYPKITALPVALSIEPTTSCNLRCPHCPSGLRSFSRPTGMLSLQTFSKVLNELAPNLMFMTLYFQGEPYLNKEFNQMVALAAKKKIYTITSSNAHFFSPQNAEETVKSGLSRLIISIDGIDQESYAHYRIGGKLSKVLEGTQNILQAKKKLRSKTPHVVWQFIVFKHNSDQIPQIKKMAQKWGVDSLQIKTAQVYDFENGADWIPEQEDLSRYTQVNGKFVFKNSLLNHCWKMWHSAVITWDGNVVPCCFDKDATHTMGSTQFEPFSHIWFGKPYQDFRTQLMKGRKEIDICKNCSEGTQVWL